MGRLTRKILALLSSTERSQLARIFLLVLFTSILEVIGISSILPFIAVVAEPGIIERSSALRATMDFFGLESVRDFTVVLGLGALGLLLISNVALALVNWRLMQFTYGLAHTISSRLLARYLGRSYEDFLASNTASARKNVLDEVVQTVNSATVPFMQAAARIPSILLVLLAVFIADPVLAPLIVLVFGGLYWLVYRGLRAWLFRIGQRRLHANEIRFRAAQESLDAIVDIKLFAAQKHYHRLYDEASRESAETQAMNMTLALTPRYALETIAFGGILLIVLYMLVANRSLEQALPLITLYAVAGYRLMPALQIVFAGVTKARFAESSLDLLQTEIVASAADPKLPDPVPPGQRLPVREVIRFENVDFTFREREERAVTGLSFEVRAGSVCGVAGATGSGKSTLANLFMGLLEPRAGVIRIDGQALDASLLPRWQANIGYVSQQIYLSDATIAENIALGLPRSQIDPKRVQAAAELANLHAFIAGELPQAYETMVGERGVRLSGGQRQRLAIARALYRDPGVLVFDEATSALDSTTEGVVMDAINRLANRKTILVIAHRIHTLRKADQVIVLSHGTILDQGSYEDLAARGRFGDPQSLGMTAG
jgi:ATP-binding cassette, subfamily B, bacterial PglK